MVAHEVLLAGDRLIFFGRMAGPIAPTQAIGGLYLIGLDRGPGTFRFLSYPPIIAVSRSCRPGPAPAPVSRREYAVT